MSYPTIALVTFCLLIVLCLLLLYYPIQLEQPNINIIKFIPKPQTPSVPLTDPAAGFLSDSSMIESFQINKSTIKNIGYGQCLTPDPSQSFEGLVDISKCNNQSSQQWTINEFGQIKNSHDQCLIPAYVTHGTKVSLEPCKEPITHILVDAPMQALNYDTTNDVLDQNDYQMWILQPVDHDTFNSNTLNSNTLKYNIINKAAHQPCLDIKETEYGLTVIEQPCNKKSSTQLWQI